MLAHGCPPAVAEPVVAPVLGRPVVHAHLAADKPVRTTLEQWDGSEGGRKWKRKRTIFRSTDCPAAYVLIAPKLVVDAHPDAWLVFGLHKRYLFGAAGFLGR